MKRSELLRSPEYWTSKAQVDLYNCANDFMSRMGMDRTRLAEHLGVSKGYVSQILNGDYDHRMSKFFELALSFGYVPKVDFVPVEKYIEIERRSSSFEKLVTEIPVVSDWSEESVVKTVRMEYNMADSQSWDTPKKVA